MSFSSRAQTPKTTRTEAAFITPLKDRYGAQIRTHYPRSLEHEIDIVEQEYVKFPDTAERVTVPRYMKEIIAEVTSLARRSPEINQRSGVSVRVSISNYETILGTAFKRGLTQGEVASPRISDLPSILASTTGKIELESVEEGREAKVVQDLVKKAIANVFGRYYSATEFDELISKFEEGLMVETGSDMPSGAYFEKLSEMANVPEMIRRVETSEDPASVASAVEFLLEGLHLNRRLNRDQVSGKYVYRG